MENECAPPVLTGQDGCVWFRDNYCEKHLIWFEEDPGWCYEASWGQQQDTEPDTKVQEPAAEDNSEPDKKEQEPAADDNCEPDKKEEDLAAAENTQQDQNYKESLKIGWHPTNRWVLAHGPQLPSQKSWGNFEWNCDSFGWWSWRLKFHMSQEKNVAAEEDAITGTVSRDGSLICFESGAMWSRATDFLSQVTNQEMPDMLERFAVWPLPDGSHANEAAKCLRDQGFVIIP